jgi:protein-L-isoaspartate(D-aspartate) O-methyltransferase
MTWARLGPLLIAAVLLGGACEDEPPPPGPAEDEPGDEAAVLRERMVDAIAAEIEGLDPRVLAALRKVPRHRFVPGATIAQAYDWLTPLPIGEGQNISAPEIVAQMSSRLELDGTEKVLEIGTGSGYQAAVLAELVPEVHTIEILETLGTQARARLAELGYDNVRVWLGDGYRGLPDEAPFDAILVTAAPPETPPALLEQLAPGGRLIVPEGEQGRVQWLMIHHKDAEGRIERVKSIPVTFEPMIHRDD